MKRDDINSLAHSKWNCKYHIVFAPKYRRMVIYSQIKTDTTTQVNENRSGYPRDMRSEVIRKLRKPSLTSCL